MACGSAILVSAWSAARSYSRCRYPWSVHDQPSVRADRDRRGPASESSCRRTDVSVQRERRFGDRLASAALVAARVFGCRPRRRRGDRRRTSRPHHARRPRLVQRRQRSGARTCAACRAAPRRPDAIRHPAGARGPQGFDPSALGRRRAPRPRRRSLADRVVERHGVRRGLACAARSERRRDRRDRGAHSSGPQNAPCASASR